MWQCSQVIRLHVFQSVVCFGNIIHFSLSLRATNPTSWLLYVTEYVIHKICHSIVEYIKIHCHMLEDIGIQWNTWGYIGMLGNAGINWDTLGFTGIWQYMLGYSGICQDILGYGGAHHNTLAYWSMLNYIKIHWCIEYTGIYWYVGGKATWIGIHCIYWNMSGYDGTLSMLEYVGICWYTVTLRPSLFEKCTLQCKMHLF